MATTGQTQTEVSQIAVDFASFISDHYINELSSLIADNHPFVAFIVIASGIEFLGKAISNNPFFEDKHSKVDFNNALSKFPSLQKYSNLGLVVDNNNNDISLYKGLRCGIVHSTCPQNGIVLTEGSNDLPNEIGLIDLSNDFLAACNYLLQGGIQMGSGKQLTDILCYIS